VCDRGRRGRSKFGAPDSDTTDVKHTTPPPHEFRLESSVTTHQLNWRPQSDDGQVDLPLGPVRPPAPI
jgi:hypothetical protein